MRVAVVIPCYNEEAVLHETHKVLSAKLQSLVDKNLISAQSFLCFVDDGSKDSTWTIMQQLSTANAQDNTPPPHAIRQYMQNHCQSH